MSLRRENGQVLLIGVLIFLVLLISIPTMIFLNQLSTQHGVTSQKKLKGRAVAEEGIAFAIQQIQATQNGGGTPPAFPSLSCPTNFNGATEFNGSQGGAFTILCTQGTQNYQLTLEATPRDTSTNPSTRIPGSSIRTIVSQRTLGVKLPNGLAASAAIVLNKARDFTKDNTGGAFTGGYIQSYFGPISCWDGDPTGLWTLDPWSDAKKWPRKFSVASVTGTPGTPPPSFPSAGFARAPDAAGQTTDLKEYWAFTDIGFQNVIDLDPGQYYENLAKTTDITLLTPLPDCNPTCLPASQIPANRSYFAPPAGVPLEFTAATGNGYGVTNAFKTTVFFVKGDAKFIRLALDLKQDETNSGGVIVTGKLTIDPTGTPAPGLNGSASVRVPPGANLEFPYGPNNFPCFNQPGSYGPCHVSHITGPNKLNFRGFLYVKGDMQVDEDFVMAGVLRVDQNLFIKSGKTLTVIYDDQINHQIHVTPFELQIDSSTAVQ